MFAIECATASGADSFALAICAMRSGSEIVILAAALMARLWLPARVEHAGLCFDPARTEALVGFVGALMLLTASAPLAYHAGARLLSPVDYDARAAIVVLSIGICVNIAVAAVVLRRDVCLGSRSWAAQTTGSAAATRPDRRSTATPGIRLAVAGQLIDAEVSVVLLIGTAIADFCGWLFIDALAGLAGAFLLSISASKIMLREGTLLIDVRAP